MSYWNSPFVGDIRGFSGGNGDFSNPPKTTIDSSAESDELVFKGILATPPQSYPPPGIRS